MINIKVPILNNESELVIHTDLENTIQSLGNDYARKNDCDCYSYSYSGGIISRFYTQEDCYKKTCRVK